MAAQGPGPRLDRAFGDDAEAARPAAERDALARWLRPAADGDVGAMSHLLNAVSPAVLAITRAVLGRQGVEAEDVAQEALLAIAQSVPRFRGDSTFSHYARRIAVRTAVGARRVRPLLREELDEGWPSPAPSSDERLEREQALSALRVLLDELPEEQAETLAMRVILGCSLDEVATATDVPVNTVRSRVRLAKKYIRRRIARDRRLALLLGCDEVDR